jgi:plastocyanin
VAAVSISGFSFGGPIQVSAGQTIRFSNLDGASHTATSGAFDTGVIGGGQSAEIVIDTPGTYTYFCDFHGSMTGTITVVAG